MYEKKIQTETFLSKKKSPIDFRAKN